MHNFKNYLYLTEKSFEDLWKYNGEKLKTLGVSEGDAKGVMRLDPTTIQDENHNIKKIGNYSEWLLTKIYAKMDEEERREFLVNRGQKVRETLDIFNRNRARIAEKDINKYKTFEDLENVANEHAETATRSQQIAKKETESETFYEDDNWIIKIPKTEYAACALGKGTKWCTAATEGNNNKFDYYNNQGHLYIMINKKDPNIKFQLHPKNRELRDVLDHNAAWSDIHGLSDQVFWDMVSNEDIETVGQDVYSTEWLKDAIERNFEFDTNSNATFVLGAEPAIAMSDERDEENLIDIVAQQTA